MATYRVQVTLATDDGNRENYVMNTWHCTANSLAGLDDFIIALKTFYNAVDGELGSYLASTGHVIKAYDLGDPLPRLPVRTVTDLALTTGSQTLPPQVGLCLSFAAARSSGDPAGRFRGRVYLGPLNATSTDGRPTTAMLSNIRSAADTLLDASDSATTWKWAIYSRTDSQARTVLSGWIDNSFDIQRRRGWEPTIRSPIPIV